MRQKAHLHSIESVNNRALWFCIVELLTLLALVVFQVYYVKNLITEKAVSYREKQAGHIFICKKYLSVTEKSAEGESIAWCLGYAV